MNVPKGATYLTGGASLNVKVEVSEAGYTAANPVNHTLSVDLVAPSVTYPAAPGSLKVDVPISLMNPTTSDGDNAYSSTSLPDGLIVHPTTGVISGTPSTANAAAVEATVTIADGAGNTIDVAINFPAVLKGEQPLSGFKYTPATLTYGPTPQVTAPAGATETLKYTTTTTSVCTVDEASGALTILDAGTCTITVTAPAGDNHKVAADTFSVTVNVVSKLALSVAKITGDDTINIVEKGAGFTIEGNTGTVDEVEVAVTIGSENPLKASSAKAQNAGADDLATWSVSVSQNAAYLSAGTVVVAVSAAKAGYTAANPVNRNLSVDLAAPSVSYNTLPASLQVGVAILSMSPSSNDADKASHSYSGVSLPKGLSIDAKTGEITGAPTAAGAAATAAVTVTDGAGNPSSVTINFPRVIKGAQTLSGFGYGANSQNFDGTPVLAAPAGAAAGVTLAYTTTTPAVCTVHPTTGKLKFEDAGECTITVTAPGNDDYDLGTKSVTVTVQPLGTLTLNVTAITGDGKINFAEKTSGFTIEGNTGTLAGVEVKVTIGTQSPVTLPITNSVKALDAKPTDLATWSVNVPKDAIYLLDGASLNVKVEVSKAGYTTANPVNHTLSVDLVAPSVTYPSAPASLKVDVPISLMNPTTSDGDNAYSSTSLPDGLTVHPTTGVISGTPATANADAVEATVTITDGAGNTTDVMINFPAVGKGEQPLSGFTYGVASLTYGVTPKVTAPAGATETLEYSAAPSNVCTVDATSGALTILDAGTCTITVTAPAGDNHKVAAETFSVTVNVVSKLALSVAKITGDDTINIVEKGAGFTIEGNTGTVDEVEVAVTIGSENPLRASSAKVQNAQGADDPATWSVSVSQNAAYLSAGTVAVSAAKAGYTAANPVNRNLSVDLAAPSVSYNTLPASLQVGVAILSMSPSSNDADKASHSYSGVSLPKGLSIDANTGEITGAPTAAGAAATAAVTVTDAAGNPSSVMIDFPEVIKGAQTLSGFGYGANSQNFDGTPVLAAPAGAAAGVTLAYTTTTSDVCSVAETTGALTFLDAGDCTITVTAPGNDNYNEGTQTVTVTVQPLDTLVLNVTTITGDGKINLAEKGAGFKIEGNTGTVTAVRVEVTIGNPRTTLTTLTTSSAKLQGAQGQDDLALWSVDVPKDLDHFTDGTVAVKVEVSKAGYTAANPVNHTLSVDLVAPSVTYPAAPASLKVGVPISSMSPQTSDTDNSYRSTTLPRGLTVDMSTGDITGTPTTADLAVTATVTVTDRAGNSSPVTIKFPAVAKGDQTLDGFSYGAASQRFDATPVLAAPAGAALALVYATTTSDVCTVHSTNGALTFEDAGTCTIIVTAPGNANYNVGQDSFTVTVLPLDTLTLNVATITGDGKINLAEKTAGFTIEGNTGTVAAVRVEVTIGSSQNPLTLTKNSAKAPDAKPTDLATWSVEVPSNSDYFDDATTVAVKVEVSKAGYTAANPVNHTLSVDLVAPAVTFAPEDNAVMTNPASNVTVTFTEAVFKADGGVFNDAAAVTLIKVSDTTNTDLAGTAQVTISGQVITIDPANSLVSGSQYTVTLLGDHVEDLPGNQITLAKTATFTVSVDYDADNDGLIEIRTLEQLNAVRWDLNGDGAADSSSDDATYADAFPDSVADAGIGNGALGCSNGGSASVCAGYELETDLDFDKDGSYADTSNRNTWTAGLGWLPVGNSSNRFEATFDGNGHVVSNLFIDRSSTNYVGLFGLAGASARLRGVGLKDVDVTGDGEVGALAGKLVGEVERCFATGRTDGGRMVGGLVGNSDQGSVSASHAAVTVTNSSSNTGGLVGRNKGDIVSSFATGAVSGTSHVGGLVGNQIGYTLKAVYASGTVTGTGGHVGGLVGENSGTVTDGYWDTQTSGRSASESGRGVGKTPSELQTPIRYDGIYANWDVDVDGDSSTDDPWDFGASLQYPALKADLDEDGKATVAEFGGGLGHQLPRPGVVVSEIAVTVAENRGTADYKVALRAEPVADVVVTLASEDAGVATVSPPLSLTFTQTNWDTERTVTVTGVDDNIDNAGNERTTEITHTVTSVGDTDYNSVTAPAVVVTVTDDDVATLRLGVDRKSLTETDSATVVTVTATRMGAALNFDLELPLTLGGTAQAGVDYEVVGDLPAITIPKKDSSSSAELRIDPLDDDVDEGVSELVEVGVAHARFGATAPAAVELMDNDDAGLTLALGRATLAEGDGATDVTVTAALLNGATAGSGDLTLPLTLGGVAARGVDYTVSGTASITITQGTSSGVTALSIDPAEDMLDEGPGEVIEVGTTYNNKQVAATLFLTDDDAGAPALSIEMAAGYSSTDPIVVRFVFPEPVTDFVANDDVTVAGGALGMLSTTDGGRTYLSEVTPNDPIPDSVTVTVKQDAVTDQSGNTGPAAAVVATANQRGVAVAPQSVTVAEGGTAAYYTVALTSAPTGDVTVTVASGDTTVATVEPALLRFTPDNWGTAQAVTVRGVADADSSPEQKRTAEVTHTAAGADYAGVAALTVMVVNKIDYDADNDGLIEIMKLEQLNAMRWDLDGNGDADVSSNDTAYAAAFPDPAAAGNRNGALGCSNGSGAAAACTGYELKVNLDFKDNASYANALANKAVWANGVGWEPVGDGSARANRFRASFDGNGHAVANLFINRPSADYVGLFGMTHLSGALIRNVGLTDVNVTGRDDVGALAGRHFGTIRHCYATGRVVGRNDVGGLVGINGWDNAQGGIHGSFAAVAVSGNERLGGLVGRHYGAMVSASYAAGAVSGSGSERGALIGRNQGGGNRIKAVYATGSVAGSSSSGLTGSAGGPAASASYWDTQTSGQGSSGRGVGKTTSELQMPIDYGGIYADWNLDLDNNGALDDPWDFGNATQYPALKVDFDGDGKATVAEFGSGLGHQALRFGLTVSETAVTVAEDGGEETYTVALRTEPAASVTVTPASGDSTVATVPSTPLTFTAKNWNIAQIVTVTGVNDNIDNAEHRTTTITHTVSSVRDLNYNGVTAPSVTVTALQHGLMMAPTVVSEFRGLRINWSPPAGVTADGYRVRLRERGTQDWTEFSVVETSAVLSGLNGGTAYEVQVRVKGTGGVWSSRTVGTAGTEGTAGYKNRVAAPPTNLDARMSGRNIALRWQDNSDDETGFKVFRSLAGASGFLQPIATVESSDSHWGTLSHVDTDTQEGTAYRYMVTSYIAGVSDELSSADAWAVRYCLPSTLPNPAGGGIARLQVMDASSTSLLDLASSSASGFEDHTRTPGPHVSAPPEVRLGQSYTLRLNGSGSISGAVGVWADFNGNDDFGDANESLSSGGAGFTVPNDAPTGVVRFRVVRRTSAESEALAPCAAFVNGEIEDFYLNVRGTEDSISNAAPYCKPAVSSNPGIFIKSVELKSFTSNIQGETVTRVDRDVFRLSTSSSGTEEYKHHTNTASTFVMRKAQGYILNITPSREPTSTEGVYHSVFLDLDQDGAFSSPRERLVVYPGKRKGDGYRITTELPFSIPRNAKAGKTRLRVMLAYTPTRDDIGYTPANDWKSPAKFKVPEPCNGSVTLSTDHNPLNGEVEDYTVAIQDVQANSDYLQDLGGALPLFMGTQVFNHDGQGNPPQYLRPGSTGDIPMRYRQPAVATTNNGVLVAIVDARWEKGSDVPSGLSVLGRRSVDNGKTWGRQFVAATHGDDQRAVPRKYQGVGDASTLVDRVNNVVYAVYHGGRGIWSGTRLKKFYVKSEDEGQTWSTPVDISGDVYKTGWANMWSTAGPAGIHLRDGTLVVPVPMYMSPRRNAVALLYSKDYGATWLSGDPLIVQGTKRYQGRTDTGGSGISEPMVVELDDGRLLMVGRNGGSSGVRYRIVAFLDGLGSSTWTEPYLEGELPQGRGNQGTTMLYTSQLDGHDRTRILHCSNTNSPASRARRELKIYLSYDGGSSWPVSKVADGANIQSCSLNKLRDGSIGLLYEYDGSILMKSMRWMRFSLAQLTDGKDAYQAPYRYRDQTQLCGKSFGGGEAIAIDNSSPADGSRDFKASLIEGKKTGSIAGWFKTSNAGAQTILTLFNPSGAANDSMTVSVGPSTTAYNNESFSFQLVRGGAKELSMHVRRGEQHYADGKWHHFAVVAGFGSNNTIHIDGVDQSTGGHLAFEAGSASSQEFSDIVGSAFEFHIGGARPASSPADGFQGDLGDLSLWYRGLLPPEVVALRQGKVESHHGLMAYWRLDNDDSWKNDRLGNLRGTVTPAGNSLDDAPCLSYSGAMSNQGVLIAGRSVTVDENGDTETYTVALASEPKAEVIVMPASANTDVATVLPSSLTFTTSDWSMAQMVTVTGINDDFDNDGDVRRTTITHTVTSADSGYNSVMAPEVAVTVTDDDTAVLALSVATNSLAESASATAVEVTATLSGATLDAGLALPLTLGGAAQAGVDYTVSGTLPTITIVKGGSSATETLMIDPVEDAIDEGTSETIAIGVAHIRFGSAAPAQVALMDDDDAGLTLTLSRAELAEAASATDVMVTAALANNAPADLVLPLTLSGVAERNVDYALTGDESITIRSGSSSGVTTLSIDPTEDSIDEGSGETIRLGTAHQGEKVAATLFLTDDDAGPPALSIRMAGGYSDRTPLPVRFVFSEPVTGFVTGDVEVMGGALGNTLTTQDGGRSYTSVVTPDSPLPGSVTVKVGANAVTDRSGNTGPAALVSATANKRGVAIIPPVTVANKIDYDDDDDGLIEITKLEQLNAMRWDLNGDGGASGNENAYAAAFPNPVAVAGGGNGALGCSNSQGAAACAGYELKADLDFEKDDSYASTLNRSTWTAGSGWLPVGNSSNRFEATFDGNGHSIANLFINRSSTNLVGLFGYADSSARLRNLGLKDANISAHHQVGALTGRLEGRVERCHASGTVMGAGSKVGGLVGDNEGGSVSASYATVAVTGTGKTGTGNSNNIGGLVGRNKGSVVLSFAAGAVAGSNNIGGLVGNQIQNTLKAVYATGTVVGSGDRVGGLVGNNEGAITAGYAKGVVSGTSEVGGLVGNNAGGTATVSYWDTEASSENSSAQGVGKTTFELQTPIDYDGIYAAWNIDVDGDGSTDDPWDFGDASQYPALKADLNGDGMATVAEFGGKLGHQLSRLGVVITPGTVTVGEDGGTATYMVALRSAPAANVRVSPASGDTTVATVSEPLTFTPDNWSTAQPVTVTGVNDNDDNAGDRQTTITHTVSSAGDLNYNGLVPPPVAVTAIAGGRVTLSKRIVRTPGRYLHSFDGHLLPMGMVVQGAEVRYQASLPQNSSLDEVSTTYSYAFVRKQGDVEFLAQDDDGNTATNRFRADWYGENLIEVTATDGNGKKATALDKVFVHFASRRVLGGDAEGLTGGERAAVQTDATHDIRKLVGSGRGMAYRPANIAANEGAGIPAKGFNKVTEPRLLSTSRGTLLVAAHAGHLRAHEAPPGQGIMVTSQ